MLTDTHNGVGEYRITKELGLYFQRSDRYLSLFVRFGLIDNTERK